MNTLSRFMLVVALTFALVLTAASADKTLKVVQKFTNNIIGMHGNIYMADVNGDGFKDIVARYSRNKKMIGGIWLWKGSKFADSASCQINLGFVTECKLATGDLNGDGMADIAFLSQYPTAHPPKVVFGRASWPDSLEVTDLRCAFEDTNFTAQDQYSSMAVADLNSDGYDDLVYQLQGNDNNGPYSGLYGGRLVAFFGGAAMDSIADWVYVGGQTYTMTGTGNTITPRYFSPWHMDVGDFNGDGKMDLLSSGWNAYTSQSLYNYKGVMQSMYNTGCGLVFLGGSEFGSTAIPDVILAAPDKWLIYTTPLQYLWMGYGVYNAGDLDGDGVDDISLPGWYMDIALLYKGSKSWTAAATNDDVLTVRDEFLSYTKGRFSFDSYSDQFGVNLMTIGDVNGDGLSDLAATRSYFGAYIPEERGIRIFLTKKGKTGAITPDYETADYVQVMPGGFDVDGDGVSEFFAHDIDNKLCLLKLNPLFISQVADVPADQGKAVRLSWSAFVDNDVSTYSHFSIWRSVPADSIVFSAVSPAEVTADFQRAHAQMASSTSTRYRWEWVKNVPAQMLSYYATTVPTVNDSMNTGSNQHLFMVIAHTGDPNVFLMSEPDSGYSVDNLAPLAPAGLAGTVIAGNARLSWKATSDPDVHQYLIYKSATSVIPDNAPVYATTTALSWTDGVALTNAAVYYVVRAEDVHGNVGEKSPVLSMSLTGVELLAGTPTEYCLRQNYPNPFNPATTIEYGIQQAGFVSVKVLNVLGEEVATLEAGYKPAGLYRVNFDASHLASGLYLYQIKSGSFMAIKKMVLLK